METTFDLPWELNEYQERAGKTALYPYRYIAMSRLCVDEKQRYDFGNKLEIYLGLEYPLVGLCNEAGEVMGVLKKIARDDGHVVTDVAKEKLTKELSDVLWYLSESCKVLGVTLDDLAKLNIKKLSDRQKRGVLQGSGDNR
jgi:NTP pyrophosphatase (non-canonical NTP hydrolase)